MFCITSPPDTYYDAHVLEHVRAQLAPLIEQLERLRPTQHFSSVWYPGIAKAHLKYADSYLLEWGLWGHQLAAEAQPKENGP